ncbi:basic amino acid ABC transporter substrate-binding protein [candidate division WWE3 bacterium CG06_land_8_20_14_3_00_42_16]|uniref:Basic amino acid ABC transporter substrate-binding protein n=4 Tax=Katanobacteria TaxID=422282 RepID=A0A2M7ALJ2_UNCKA|nr:MAG: basic amino acid ABC transporter substrate-binding protein [candidate division WWE3 bacterium CG06_land_8_20_14_3_00_42_16]PIZ43919.1 MAG: basic amino acid ABC transporter substrate-binding protein [candidate division WWE3 bacterium CG_4_10_14_0_2_um_filter_42_8]PJA38443.1 MAG: basic amino acid ABC transporter substrate-binding protein [candidate division WWE3 bacterium CG_4_9_14_3_um_filter_43_9]PJC68949.1 MAG: basic amino acid ABC transporter substrate-binding protein [candidate divisi
MKKVLLVFTILIVSAIAVGAYFYLKSPSQEEVSDPTLLRIKEAGKITVGAEATYPPMESIDEKGEMIGFDMDLAKEIAADLDVSVEFVNIPWDDIFTSLVEGKVDMLISSVTILPERTKDMAFSDPYFNAGQVIIVTEDNQDIKGPGDLQGKKVGLQKGTTSEFEILNYLDEDSIVDYDNYAPAPDDLKAGKIDAIIIDYPAGLGILKNHTGVKLVGNPFTQEFYGVAVQKTDQVLLTEINKTIRDLKQSGQFKELEQKWF